MTLFNTEELDKIVQRIKAIEMKLHRPEVNINVKTGSEDKPTDDGEI